MKINPGTLPRKILNYNVGPSTARAWPQPLYRYFYTRTRSDKTLRVHVVHLQAPQKQAGACLLIATSACIKWSAVLQVDMCCTSVPTMLGRDRNESERNTTTQQSHYFHPTPAEAVICFVDKVITFCSEELT